MVSSFKLGIFLLVSAAQAASAQQVGSGGALVGRILDAKSGRPVIKTTACAYLVPRSGTLDLRCADADTTGAYRIDGIPAGVVPTDVRCDVIVGFGPILGSDTLSIENGMTSRRDWMISPEGCDPRPIRRLIGTFSGHLTLGFEESSFVPCPADSWFLPSDSLDSYPYEARDAWVRFPDQRSVALPSAAPLDEYGNPQYFVKLHGAIIGPGKYGHLGVSVFEFQVDSLLEARPGGSRDC
jgi:hypothetical protein